MERKAAQGVLVYPGGGPDGVPAGDCGEAAERVFDALLLKIGVKCWKDGGFQTPPSLFSFITLNTDANFKIFVAWSSF